MPDIAGSAANPVWAAGLILRCGSDGLDHFLLLRNNRHGDWGFPKGHRQGDEDLWATALRECAEETGIACLHATGPAVDIAYLVAGRPKQVRYWPARCRQQRLRLSGEHAEGLWLDAEACRQRLAHANLLALFDQLCQG